MAGRRLRLVPVALSALALLVAGCGGDDPNEEAGAATTTLGSSADSFPAEQQAVRAYLGDEGREPQAIICGPQGANATCSVTFEDGTCERYEVESGARTVVKPDDGGTCPERTETEDG